MVFSTWGKNKMGHKKIGRADYLGSNVGGVGYFVKYCAGCGEKIYLMEGNGELEEFLLASYIPRLGKLLKAWIRPRLWIPKIKLECEWQNPRQLEIVKLNERIELSDNKKLVFHDPKKFSRNFFEKKYSALGGIKKLEEMISDKFSSGAIGSWFGFSRQRAFVIIKAYRLGEVVD